MKVSKKELYMLLIVAGIAIAVCSFVFGFRKINDKTEALRIETEALESDVKKYNAVKDNIDVYNIGIDDATKKIAEVIAKIPSDVLPEDAFMLARELEKNDEYTFVDAVMWEDETTVYTVTSHPVDDTKTPIVYYLNNNEVSIVHTSSYQGIKDMIDYIYEHKNRMALESFAVAYDEKTGLLSGSTNVNFYSLVGSDKEYKEQNIQGVQMGTNNIFGTRVVPEN